MSLLRIFLVFVPLAVVIPACAEIRVESHYNSSTDFKLFKTYAWATQGAHPGPVHPAEAADIGLSRVAEVVGDVLESRGIRKVDRPHARLLVSVVAKIEERLRVPIDPYYAFYQVENYQSLTIVITFVGRGTGKTLWWGSGRLDFDALGTRDELAKRICDVVHAILEHYPPGRKAIVFPPISPNFPQKG